MDFKNRKAIPLRAYSNEKAMLLDMISSCESVELKENMKVYFQSYHQNMEAYYCTWVISKEAALPFRETATDYITAIILLSKFGVSSEAL